MEVVCPFVLGILLTVIVPVPGLAICDPFNRTRVMIDASHVTTGVTPVALVLQ
jgi:hypothetical protein